MGELDDFRSSLNDLTVNSKPLISMLTMLAEENQAHAEQVVQVIESHIFQAKPAEKLPSLYLIDSILKNLRSTNYASFFQQNIVKVFCHVFEQVEERTRQSMFKLRQTWNELLNARKLYALDVRVNQIDPAWPVAPAPEPRRETPKSPTSIHVNPRFLQGATASTSSAKMASETADMASQIEQKKRELARIEQKRVELELAKAQAQLQQQERELLELQNKLALAASAPPAVVNPAVQAVTTVNPDQRTLPDPRLQKNKQTDPRVIPVDPRVAQSHLEPSVPSHPRVDNQSVLPDPRMSSQQAAPVPQKGFPNENQSAEKKPQSSAPPLTSVGALLNQAYADAALGDNRKPIKRKLPKTHKLRDEQAEPRTFKGHGVRDNRPVHNRGKQWANRGRGSRDRAFNSSRVPERPLPYDRPSTKSKSREDSGSTSRRRDGRSKSPSRSPTSRTQSRSRSSSTSRSRSRSPSRKLSSVSSSKVSDSRRKEEREPKSKMSTKKKSENEETTKSSSETKEAHPDSQLSSSSGEKLSAGATSETALSSSSTTLTTGESASSKNSPGSDVLFLSKKGAKSKDSKSKAKDMADKVTGMNREAASKQSDSLAQSSQDIDLRKGKPAPTSKELKKKDGGEKRRQQSKSPQRIRSPVKKRKDNKDGLMVPQDEDLRKKDSLSPVNKDEDLRTNRQVSRAKQEWESSKAKQMPRIPKRKAKGQYRKRDETSPSLDSVATDAVGSQDTLTLPDESNKPVTNKGDVDLRSLPMVQAPSRSDEDSSDSDAEARATLDKRRKQRSKILEDGTSDDKAAKDQSRNKRSSSNIGSVGDDDKDVDLRMQPPKNSDQSRKKRKVDRKDRKPEVLEDEDLRVRAPSARARQNRDESNKDTDMRSKSNVNVKHILDMHAKGIGNVNPQIVDLLAKAMHNRNDPRVRQLLTQLTHGPPAQHRPPGHKMAFGKSAGLLPTPSASMNSHLTNMHTGTKSFNRMNSQEVRKGREVTNEVVIDGHPFELTMGKKPRKIHIGGHECEIQADKRELLIDGKCYYKIGEPIRDWYLKGEKHTIFYQGAPANFWLDDMQLDVRIDAPPLEIDIQGTGVIFQVEGHTNRFFIDSVDVGPFGGPPYPVTVAGRRFMAAFEPPPREILIDGKLCKLKFDGPTPVVIVDGKAHGIRFNGPAREILIDDMSFMVPMDHPLRVKIGLRSHMLSFGGPGQEVIIDDKPYEVMFNGPPRTIKIGGTMRQVCLQGPAPDVKILGEILPEETAPSSTKSYSSGDRLSRSLAPPPRPPLRGGLLPTPNIPAEPQHRMPLQHPPRPPFFNRNSRSADFKGQDQDFRGSRGPLLGPAPGYPFNTPQSYGANHKDGHGDQDFRAPRDFSGPSFSNNFGAELTQDVDLRKGSQQTANQNDASSAAASTPAPLDINSLFNKLLAHGIINKKDEVDKMEKIPDLTGLSTSLLHQKYTGVIQRLYTGNQCSTCGLRFMQSAESKYSDHLDWHFRQNTRDKEKRVGAFSNSRQWYISVDDWVKYEEFSDIKQMNLFLDTQPETAPASGTTGDIPLHPDAVHCPTASGTDVNDTCVVCHEPFERFWDDDEEEWHLKDAVKIQNKTYHPVCYEDAVETSIMEHSMSVEEMATAGSIPPSPRSSVHSQSPRTSIPPESPRTPLLSPSSMYPQQVNVSSGVSVTQSSSKPATSVNPFDLLSGLISKTESKPSTVTSSGNGDALQMLAGLMKSVKTPVSSEEAPPSTAAETLPSKVEPSFSKPATPPTATETQSIHTEKAPLNKETSTTAVSGAENIKLEPTATPRNSAAEKRTAAVEVKKEPTEFVKKISTIGSAGGGGGGIRIPQSNVTILPTIPPTQDYASNTDGARSYHPHSHRPSLPPRHHPLPVHPGQPPMRLLPPKQAAAPPMMMHHLPPTLPQHRVAPPVQFRGAPPMSQQSAGFCGPPAGSLLPRGSLPPGTLPPGSLPRGSLPPGTLPPGSLPPGTLRHSLPNMSVSASVMIMSNGMTTADPPPMMALAGHPSTMVMTSMPPVVQPASQVENNDDDEGTPVRDEKDDGVERCATPVMDEGDDGGSTPVRDEKE